jgi:undecaprenyl-diphosphatase
MLAEDFSFALAVVLTPPVILKEWLRLFKHAGGASGVHWSELLTPGIIGRGFSFVSGLLALKFLSVFLEKGRWWVFGVYCFGFAGVVKYLAMNGY